MLFSNDQKLQHRQIFNYIVNMLATQNQTTHIRDSTPGFAGWLFSLEKMGTNQGGP